jgi:hypothetical protein
MYTSAKLLVTATYTLRIQPILEDFKNSLTFYA